MPWLSDVLRMVAHICPTKVAGAYQVYVAVRGRRPLADQWGRRPVAGQEAGAPWLDKGAGTLWLVKGAGALWLV